MPETRILVLGAGSIGRRHAANLLAAGASVDIADPVPPPVSMPAGAGVRPYVLDALRGYDGIVVASPTVHHLDQARWALSTGARVMVEKPLAASGAGLDAFVAEAAGRVMVGYNLRLHAPVARLVGLVGDGAVGEVLGVRAWFGSWLPDWRPNVDYRTTYSARSDLGGGVLVDAIHELDLVLWLLPGEHTVCGAFVGRVGPLEIDVEDTVHAVLRHESGAAATVSLDYLSRRYRRGLEVTGTAGNVRLDWARRTIEVETADGVTVETAEAEVADSYVEEARRFVAFVERGEPVPVDAVTGAASVRLADAIRAAATGAGDGR